MTNGRVISDNDNAAGMQAIHPSWVSIEMFTRDYSRHDETVSNVQTNHESFYTSCSAIHWMDRVVFILCLCCCLLLLADFDLFCDERSECLVFNQQSIRLYACIIKVSPFFINSSIAVGSGEGSLGPGADPGLWHVNSWDAIKQRLGGDTFPDAGNALAAVSEGLTGRGVGVPQVAQVHGTSGEGDLQLNVWVISWHWRILPCVVAFQFFPPNRWKYKHCHQQLTCHRSENIFCQVPEPKLVSWFLWHSNSLHVTDLDVLEQLLQLPPPGPGGSGQVLLNIDTLGAEQLALAEHLFFVSPFLRRHYCCDSLIIIHTRFYREAGNNRSGTRRLLTMR